MHVLIVEDNFVNQALLQRLVTFLGHTHDSVSNGEDALLAVQRNRYDLIFMDLQMPQLDGIETARRIRALPEHEILPPIVAITANSLNRTRLSCRDAGMNDFLTKPITLEDIRTALDLMPGREHQLAVRSLRQRLDYLAQLGDFNFLIELIAIFKRDNRQRLERVRELLAQGGYKTAAEISHLTCGSAANLGAQRLQQACAYLQETCDGCQPGPAQVALRQAFDELAAVEGEIDLWISNASLSEPRNEGGQAV